MKWTIHGHSLRYALALWLATVLALLTAFLVQLEPAQWAAITVWIMFMQEPSLNYSKVIWWAFGTLVGAGMAVILTICFCQAPELCLLFLALWLAVCAASAKLVSSYRAYGWVLAGYTCAIVTMSATEHPHLIFRFALTRVSCIFIGMASAILMMLLWLPKHRHWRETRRRLGEHLRATLLQAAKTLAPDVTPPVAHTWRHMAERLSRLEHTLDLTTAESADSRIHAPQARSLIAALFELLAKTQAIEVHRSRTVPGPGEEVQALLSRAGTLLAAFAASLSTVPAREPAHSTRAELERLRSEIARLRRAVPGQGVNAVVSNCFLLARLDELLEEFDHAIQDWSGLFGPWTAPRPAQLALHQDYPTALLYGLRMFLAITLASAIWFITQWPSGSQFILFIAVVCSLLSLVDYAPQLGITFLKSAVFCAIMAYIEGVYLLPRGEDFLSLALMLGLFLLPAAYAYRHPRLLGGAVVSMLIFYGLSMPANPMNYDIAAFLNNGLALLGAAACGFFAFHAVPSLDPKARQFWLLQAVRRDLAHSRSAPGTSVEQGWTSRMFDRLRLLHRTAGQAGGSLDVLKPENELVVSLQLGLRQRRLGALLQTGALVPEEARLVAAVFPQFREIGRRPHLVAGFLHSTCARLEQTLGGKGSYPAGTLGALAEMREMTLLLETSSPLSGGCLKENDVSRN